MALQVADALDLGARNQQELGVEPARVPLPGEDDEPRARCRTKAWPLDVDGRLGVEVRHTHGFDLDPDDTKGADVTHNDLRGLEGCWVTRTYGNAQVFNNVGKDEGTTSCYGAVVLKNPHWPGWSTVASIK